jgi:NADH-quinone oxidoreductase subunit I
MKREIKGMLTGLGVTFRTMTKPAVTVQYPHEREDPVARARGVIALKEENCTVCMLCARSCPDWCIYIEGHKEQRPPRREGGKPRNVSVLDRFDIDYALCMYCGICVEVCPFDALFWSPEFEYSETRIADLLHDKDRLGEWMRTVPPPPAHDVLGEPSKEEATAARKAAGPGAATAAKTARPAAVRTSQPPTAPPAVPPAPVQPAEPRPSAGEPGSEAGK